MKQFSMLEIATLCKEHGIELVDCNQYNKWKVPKSRLVSWDWVANALEKRRNRVRKN